MRKHTITFDQMGDMKIDATGYVGTACAEMTAKLTEGLGAQQVEEHKKMEYHQANKVGATATERRW